MSAITAGELVYDRQGFAAPRGDHHIVDADGNRIARHHALMWDFDPRPSGEARSSINCRSARAIADAPRLNARQNGAAGISRSRSRHYRSAKYCTEIGCDPTAVLMVIFSKRHLVVFAASDTYPTSIVLRIEMFGFFTLSKQPR